MARGCSWASVAIAPPRARAQARKEETQFSHTSEASALESLARAAARTRDAPRPPPSAPPPSGPRQPKDGAAGPRRACVAALGPLSASAAWHFNLYLSSSVPNVDLHRDIYLCVDLTMYLDLALYMHTGPQLICNIALALYTYLKMYYYICLYLYICIYLDLYFNSYQNLEVLYNPVKCDIFLFGLSSNQDMSGSPPHRTRRGTGCRRPGSQPDRSRHCGWRRHQMASGRMTAARLERAPSPRPPATPPAQMHPVVNGFHIGRSEGLCSIRGAPWPDPWQCSVSRPPGRESPERPFPWP